MSSLRRNKARTELLRLRHAKPATKQVSILASLAYGWRLTVKHLKTLVPGTIVFYLPEWLSRLGLPLQGWGIAITAFKTAVGCWLLWHALQLADQETRQSRLHEPTLPAPGYLGRFIASTLLFWGVLGLALWPALRLASGAWVPDAAGQARSAEFLRPWAWGSLDHGALYCSALPGVALALVPAGLWAVYGWFHGYYVADEGQGAWQSMVSSFHSVRGAFWRTTAFLGVIGLVNALGLALWFAGIFVAFPVTLMATTYVHLELKAQKTPFRALAARPRRGKMKAR